MWCCKTWGKTKVLLLPSWSILLQDQPVPHSSSVLPCVQGVLSGPRDGLLSPTPLPHVDTNHKPHCGSCFWGVANGEPPPLSPHLWIPLIFWDASQNLETLICKCTNDRSDEEKLGKWGEGGELPALVVSPSSRQFGTPLNSHLGFYEGFRRWLLMTPPAVSDGLSLEGYGIELRTLYAQGWFSAVPQLEWRAAALGMLVGTDVHTALPCLSALSPGLTGEVC